ncbi:alpha/beta fold hydrolase [Comamonas thiooxydans]|uniref:alpha/beta fold hydrolase n=1 Tax=Comamonas thiooxydans TaxID=363952 RepID=UPI00209C238A|nr:alpha/beta hydrolase [Comamonas thiooxydans]MCO8251183.1 alpha/beta hydrolase [Comamonas thiooxydans]
MNAVSGLRAKPSPGAALLLIPGMLNKPGIWDGVIDGLREQLGDSVEIAVADVLSQTTIADMAKDAWERLEDVEAETPCYVAGFSMGGYVALEMLAHQQRPLSGAWLISTSVFPESPESASMREKSIANFQQDFEKTIYNTARWGTFEKTPEQFDPLVQAMRELGAETAIRQTRAIMNRRDLREPIGQLDIPVQVLCGTEDRITPPKLSEAIAALIPTAQLRLIEKSGHMMPFENASLIAHSICQRIAA